MQDSMVERVARALAKKRHATALEIAKVFDDIDGLEIRERPWTEFVEDARAVLAAMKYADGLDDDRMIAVSKAVGLDAAIVAEVLDAVLDAALSEGGEG